jgi:hypothetical protein
MDDPKEDGWIYGWMDGRRWRMTTHGQIEEDKRDCDMWRNLVLVEAKTLQSG